MPLKDLAGKTVYDLEPEDFEKLFCKQCRQKDGGCFRRFRDISVCMALIDSGVWDEHYRE